MSLVAPLALWWATSSLPHHMPKKLARHLLTTNTSRQTWAHTECLLVAFVASNEFLVIGRQWVPHLVTKQSKLTLEKQWVQQVHLRWVTMGEHGTYPQLPFSFHAWPWSGVHSRFANNCEHLDKKHMQSKEDMRIGKSKKKIKKSNMNNFHHTKIDRHQTISIKEDLKETAKSL